jgi:hypothetical protein
VHSQGRWWRVPRTSDRSTVDLSHPARFFVVLLRPLWDTPARTHTQHVHTPHRFACHARRCSVNGLLLRAYTHDFVALTLEDDTTKQPPHQCTSHQHAHIFDGQSRGTQMTVCVSMQSLCVPCTQRLSCHAIIVGCGDSGMSEGGSPWTCRTREGCTTRLRTSP